MAAEFGPIAVHGSDAADIEFQADVFTSDLIALLQSDKGLAALKRPGEFWQMATSRAAGVAIATAGLLALWPFLRSRLLI